MLRWVQGRRQAWRKAASFKPYSKFVVMVAWMSCASMAHGQSSTGVEAYEEFGKRLRAAQEVTPLTSDLFGDHVSLYNGSLEFDVTDIDIPGNGGLPMQFGRRLETEDRRLPTGHLGGMGDWDVEMPYIEGVFTREDGWTVQSALANPQQSYNRCSLPNVPYMYRAGTKDTLRAEVRRAENEAANHSGRATALEVALTQARTTTVRQASKKRAASKATQSKSRRNAGPSLRESKPKGR